MEAVKRRDRFSDNASVVAREGDDPEPRVLVVEEEGDQHQTTRPPGLGDVGPSSAEVGYRAGDERTAPQTKKGRPQIHRRRSVQVQSCGR